MEPNNNFETQLKTQLALREIKPSPQAWDRLDAMLTVSEQKKPNQKLNWLMIAAGFVGILFATFVLFQMTNSLSQKRNIVTVQKNHPKIAKTNQDKVTNPVQIDEKEIIVQQNQPTKIKAIPKINTQSIINQKTTVASNPSQNQNQNEVLQIISNSKTEGSISVKPESLLAEIQKTNPTEKTNAETVKINPNSLLSQVDGELNQEFRETRFQKLKRNFKSVKVAMALRNQK